MAPQPGIHLALCTLLAATALAARVQMTGERRCTSAGGTPVDQRWRTGREEFSYEGSNGRTGRRDYEYEGPLGPAFWPTMFPNCGGQAQSPVDIRRRDVRGTKYRSVLIIPDFEWRASEVKVVNTGYTAQVVPVDRDSVKYSTLHGGPLTGVYELKEINFRWGRNDDKGSEHAIDGAYFAMEMQMVFSRNITRRGREKSHREHNDFAVIVIFFKVSPRDNIELAPIVQTLPKVVVVGSEAPVLQSFSTSGLVPCVCTGMLIYNGSLTAPPCSETVVWLIFPRPFVISRKQVSEFRKLRTPSGTLNTNRRPIQPLNDRVVHTSRSEPAFRPSSQPRCGLLLAGALSLRCALYS